MSKKRRSAILATVAVLAVGGIIAGGLTVQSAAVAAEAAEVAAAQEARAEAAARQAAYEQRVEAEALSVIEAATPVIAAAQGKVDAAALATPVASLTERATLEVEVVEDLIEQASAAIPAVEAAIVEADRVAAEAAAAAAAAEAERVAAEAAEAAQAAAAAEAARAASATPAGAQAIARDMMASKYGWGSDQASCLVNLWQKESGWRVDAYNASSGATGIPQSLPGSKMATHGADWKTNASTQISWGLDYIKRAYGTPCGAWGHSQSVNWY
ncbi:hypothetical protein [Homoserinimonas hongtaonis]|uniref:Phospholipase n=1 Tax=Homoserinimonas hongtaonis TaxID=2079791 RepID=A0A2U1SY27_9MICO|nr:hypothetical protein [Salinibacterium hongtaonis]PWB96509.1 hypothetical protein DF220_00605 [Salinibacterium hongtaonis]